MVHYYEGGQFHERNREQIRELLGARQCVNLHIGLHEIVGIPLNGPFGQFDVFFDMLKNRYALTSVDFLNISGDIETVIPVSVDFIEFFKLSRSRRAAVFGLFEYDNLTDIDLSRYQIFDKEAGDWDESQEPCLIHTLQTMGIETSVIDHLKANIPGYYVNRSILQKVSLLTNRCVKLYFAGSNELLPTSPHRMRFAIYGSRDLPLLEVACFKNHLFVYETTKFSGYSIRNYDCVSREREWWNIVGRDALGCYNRRPSGAKLSSLHLVSLLYRLGKFEESDRYLRYPKFNHRAILNEQLIPNEQRLFHRTIKHPYDCPAFFFADIECATGGEKHVPIVSGFCCEDDSFYQMKGVGCIKLMFDKIVERGRWKSDLFVYFHNLKYDWAVLSSELTKISSICKKDNQLYSCVIFHRNRMIVLRDSFKLISKPLKDFQRMFDLCEGKKEAIPYDFYTVDNINEEHTMVSIDTLKTFFKTENDKELFEQILQEEHENQIVHGREKNFTVDLVGRSVNAVEYYLYYHQHDCITLKRGMEVFRERLGSFTNDTLSHELDIFQFITISSFADCYYQLRGCYNGCYELQSNNRSFVQEAVRGGVCYANPKFVKRTLTNGISDFDMTSMYPSAEKRIGQECGFPMGPCRKIPNDCLHNYPFHDYSYYVVRIRILSINKQQQIPFVSLRVGGLVRRYNKDELPPSTLVVDKITLEDYCNFCDLHFVVLEGLYWQEGGVHEIGDTITMMKELRDEYRADNNPIQELIKLLMNTSYGKLVMRKTNESYIIKKADAVHNYISERFGLFKQVTQFGQHAEIKMAKYDDSYSRNHLGCLVLSMSKRYLHEVLDLCNFLCINIYYVDTDSLHIDADKIPLLRNAYRHKYGLELIGKNLGQFHADFSISCGHSENTISNYCIILGPKVYYDELVCLVCSTTGVHFRMKGIPAMCVYATCRREDITIHELYNRLIREPMIFYLNPPEFVRFCIKVTGVYTLPTNSFTRMLSF